MTEIITAKYRSNEPLINAYDELVSSGIPREKIRISKDTHELSVAVPEASDAGITEILRRHEPKTVDRHELRAS